MHAHAITLLHHVSQMMLYDSDHELLHTFFFPSFWYRSILISSVHGMLFQKYSGFFKCFLAKSNLALFAPCGEPSVFVLMKSSLDCRLWQWHVYLLESVLLAGCWERFFFTMEKILRSSTAVVFYGHPGLFMLLRSLVRSFFSECIKLLIWLLWMFLLSLWWVCFVFEA